VVAINIDSHLEDGVHPLVKKHVQDMEHEEEWEFSCKQGEKPLRGEHVGFDSTVTHVGPQVWQIFLNQSVQLI